MPPKKARDKMAIKFENKRKVTVGLCVKNSESTIKNCLKSILSQRYPKNFMKIIVVDGDSTDQTIKIAEDVFSRSNTLYELYYDKGKGLGTARQIVLDNTETKYVIWVDGDVFLSRNFVANQVDFMENNPEVGVATGKYVYKKSHVSIPAMLQSLGKYVGSIEFSQETTGLPPNDTSIYRIKAVRDVGGFDRNIKGASEDEDIIIRMRKEGWLVSVNKKADYYAFTRETWGKVWAESKWFGYGKHFLSHKYNDPHVLARNTPIVFFIVGLRTSIKAYKLTLQKESFLLPLASVFTKIAFWFGFIKAHTEGYGHKENQKAIH